MVPLIETSNLAVPTTLRKRIAESSQRDLSKAFVAWLLEDYNHPANLLSIVAQAAKREGAGQDFQTIAILGFGADAGVLSETELSALKKGLGRLAGRSPVVNGVPMPFTADAVGILGIALGTAIVANAEVTGQVVGWAMRFLKSGCERDRAEDWQRCLLAAADLKLGKALDLAMPKSVATADVRIALLARGLIEAGGGMQARQAREDATRTLDLAVHSPIEDFDYDRAALRVAAVEWVTRQRQPGESAQISWVQETQQPKDPRKVKKPVRRNQKYKVIDKALREIAGSRPRTQEEVFQSLEGRHVAIPPVEPFFTARGWMAGFHLDAAAARSWLSKRWAKLGLAPFPRGPKTERSSWSNYSQ